MEEKETNFDVGDLVKWSEFKFYQNFDEQQFDCDFERIEIKHIGIILSENTKTTRFQISSSKNNMCYCIKVLSISVHGENKKFRRNEEFTESLVLYSEGEIIKVANFKLARF